MARLAAEHGARAAPLEVAARSRSRRPALGVPPIPHWVGGVRVAETPVARGALNPRSGAELEPRR